MNRVLLLAAGSRFFRSQGWSSLLPLILVGVGVVVLAVIGRYVWSTLRPPRVDSENATPDDLFAELCRAHALSRPDQALIADLARAYDLPQAARIFIDPSPLDRAASASGAEGPRYQALRQKLFGSIS